HTRDELKAGKYDQYLSNHSILALRGDADTEVDRIERKQEAQRKENERQVGKLVSDYKEAKMSGFDWRGAVSESRLGQLAQGTEHEVDFKNIQAASRILGLFNQETPAAQADYLRAIASGVKTGS